MPENSSKNKKSSQSIDDLIKAIYEFSGDWCEHKIVLEKISRWLLGNRFDANDYRAIL